MAGSVAPPSEGVVKTLPGLVAYLSGVTLGIGLVLPFAITWFPRHPATVIVTFLVLWLAVCALGVYDYMAFDRSEERAHRALAKNFSEEL
jgi:ABC-type spermidine/putrescine transport system permease subunit II